jgi:hypothetical protein
MAVVLFYSYFFSWENRCAQRLTTSRLGLMSIGGHMFNRPISDEPLSQNRIHIKRCHWSIYLSVLHAHMTERSKMNERLPVTTPNGMFLYVSVSTVTRGQDSTSLFPKLRKNCVVSFSYYFQFNYTIIRYILSHNDPLYTKQSLKHIHLQFTNVYI